MNRNRHADQRFMKTEKAIKDAFKEMICKMDVSKITVKGLTEAANIHRKTFYLHYASIESLFEDILFDAANSYYEKIDQIQLPMRINEVNRVFFIHFSKQEKYMEKLVCSPRYSEFSDELFQMNLTHNRSRYNPYAAFSPEKQNIINTFLVSSSLSMYRQWITDQKQIPLEEMIELSSSLLQNGASSIPVQHPESS